MIHYHTVPELAEKSGRTPYQIRKFARTRPNTIHVVSQTMLCINDADFQLYLRQCQEEDARRQTLPRRPARALALSARLRGMKTAEDIGEVLNLPAAEVLRLAVNHNLPYHKRGRSIYFEPREIACWVAECLRGMVAA